MIITVANIHGLDIEHYYVHVYIVLLIPGVQYIITKQINIHTGKHTWD